MNLSFNKVSATTVTFTISNMKACIPINHKMFTVKIRKCGDTEWMLVDVVGGDSPTGILCANGSFTYTCRNLKPRTDYEIRIAADMMTYDGSFITEGVLEGSFMTSA